jgi:hypothetical protein
VAGKDKNGHGYVLADISGRYPPTEWARLAITAYDAGADRGMTPRNRSLLLVSLRPLSFFVERSRSAGKSDPVTDRSFESILLQC